MPILDCSTLFFLVPIASYGNVGLHPDINHNTIPTTVKEKAEIIERSMDPDLILTFKKPMTVYNRYKNISYNGVSDGKNKLYPVLGNRVSQTL